MENRKENPKMTACSEWEIQLAEVLDGVLEPEKELGFQMHMTTCAACTELYEEARRGREWLGFLAEEPAVPEGLLERILMTTGPATTGYSALTPAVAGAGMHVPPVWQRPNFMARASRFASRHFEPRLLLTAAMAFFSIALTLNLSGFRLDRIHMGWISPNVIRSIMERRVTAASSPLVRYYDHMRDSYEVDSKVRVIEKTTEGFAAPLKISVEKNQPEETQPEQNPAQQETPLNQTEPESAPMKQNTAPNPETVTPQNSVTPQSEPQKQSEPKVPGKQGAEIQLPQNHDSAGTAQRTGAQTQQRNQNNGSSSGERTLALLTAGV